MTKLIHWFIPRYGNWGGPGWSSGRWHNCYENTDWSIPAVDSLDELFKEHDLNYKKAIDEFDNLKKREGEFSKADKKLSERASNLSINPIEWESPPKDTSNFYSWFYRKLVIFIFYIRGRF